MDVSGSPDAKSKSFPWIWSTLGSSFCVIVAVKYHGFAGGIASVINHLISPR